jgi:hypothetical protein
MEEDSQGGKQDQNNNPLRHLYSHYRFALESEIVDLDRLSID